MIKIGKYSTPEKTIPFDRWLDKVRNRRASKRILTRIRRLSLGLEGDWKPVGEGVRELRITEGKGYRVYYAWSGESYVLLLLGGDKSTQHRDIETAKQYWRQYRSEDNA